jgi:hypothetical protein
MDALALIARAADAGLSVDAQDGALVVRGPARLDALAHELLDHKVEVLAHLTGESAGIWPCPAAREHYLERLAIADDLGLDTGPGSMAQAIALREARRVTAGLPPAWSGSRGRESIDIIIDAFATASFVGFIDSKELAPVWPEPMSRSSLHTPSNPAHGGVHPQQPEATP